ncbi:MAG: hypothetical protein JRN54_00010 [Nitrososphaerota archaeon]|nr:hypothetical protein [Nitrososphaerota archaeon]
MDSIRSESKVISSRIAGVVLVTALVVAIANLIQGVQLALLVNYPGSLANDTIPVFGISVFGLLSVIVSPLLLFVVLYNLRLKQKISNMSALAPSLFVGGAFGALAGQLAADYISACIYHGFGVCPTVVFPIPLMQLVDSGISATFVGLASIAVS